MRRVSQVDVARRAGVSTGLVSTVLNNPHLVGPERRALVEEAMHELGYVRNGLARALKEGSRPTVGCLVLDISNPFFTDAIRGVEDELRDSGLLVVVSSSDEDPDRESTYLRMLEESSVRGIVTTPSRTRLDALEAIRDRGTPVVLLARAAPRGRGFCAVAQDHAGAGRLVAEHLLSLGHSRIGFINGGGEARRLDGRRRHLRRALLDRGLAEGDFLEVSVSAVNSDAGEEGARQLLSLPHPPSAIACVNDLVALGALRAARGMGLRIPEDVALVGHDDIEFSASLAVPLTSVREPRYEMGRQAARLLLQEDEALHKHRQLVVPAELVVRASTAGAGPRLSP